MNYFSEVRKSSGFELNRIDFDQQEVWKIKKGILSHKSGGFFNIVGVKNTIDYKCDLFLFQPQSALTGLLIHKTNDEIYILVQARIEPGNTGVLQFGPTVQSTPSNYMRVHGGKSTSYLSLFYSANENILGFNSTNHLDLGKIYYQKTKWLNYALVDHLVETENSFIWSPLSVLMEAAHKDYILNTDLRSLLAVYDWESLLGFQPNNDFNHTNILQYYTTKRLGINCIDRFVPLDKAESFRISNNAIYSNNEKDSEIGLYSVRTKHREVDAWIQPLWKAKDKGMVLLLCRHYNSEKDVEFLLSVKYEKGISGKLSISPSYLKYPNELVDDSRSNIGTTLFEFHQSDEGGRFINHQYHFRVAEVQSSISVDPNQFWVSTGELKKILSTPCMANIQLRNICSVLVKKMNPSVTKYN